MTLVTLAIPSKGRLHEQSIARFAASGLIIRKSQSTRDYSAVIDQLPSLSVQLLSAAEITEQLASGKIHLGLTGEDLLCDHAIAPRTTEIVKRLGFGRADVVVAVPKSWMDVSVMADLDDVAAAFHMAHSRKLRVATKYMNLARDFFASHGIADYRIVESLGATEGTPAAGTAEVIVDITSTGATLAANHLKPLDDGIILRSEAVLAVGKNAPWSNEAETLKIGLLEKLR